MDSNMMVYIIITAKYTDIPLKSALEWFKSIYFEES